MIKVGIVGGTGYTGVELLRLLALHPQAEVSVITSRSEDGVKVADMYPNLRDYYPELTFSNPSAKELGQCDAVFFATPHGVAHGLAAELLAEGTKVLDLSADFRLENIAEWEQWYGQTHGAPELVAEAVYGLPEVNREAIKQARLIAVPGCYPTAVQLGWLPLVEAGLVSGPMIASCASGVSGAGRGTKLGSLFCEATENMMAYAVTGHRHLPEIKQGLRRASAGQNFDVTFTPHLVPMIRGIHASLYATVQDRTVDLQQLFEQYYQNEQFVDVLPAGINPQTRSVRGANYCRLAVYRPQDGDTVVVLSVIDNLVKGASGQAIQNLNILFGWPENSGLEAVALMP